MTLVLDCSATLAWIYADETTPAIVAVFDQVIHKGGFVPSLWRIEVANSLTVSLRRNRISAQERRDSLADLADLAILADDETGRHVWAETLELSDRHSLTVYDATYLELALRRELPLATLDRELRKAAVAERVPLLGM